MNVKSRYDPEEVRVKEPKKQYLWLGYGQSNQFGGGRGRLMGGVWDAHTFDLIFERLGLKKKNRRRSNPEEKRLGFISHWG
jgi:hypothetical protein